MADKVFLIDRTAHLFEELNTIVTVTSALAIASELHVSGNVNYKAGDYLVIEAQLLQKEVRLPLVGPVAAALMNRLPDLIEITVVDGIHNHKPYKVETAGFRALLVSMFQPLLVNYFERHRDALATKFGTDRPAWPNSWQMGWLIRNGLSHGNKVFFDRPTAKPVSWGGLTLSATDNGKQLVYGMINQGDLLLLMFEMEAVLFAAIRCRDV